MLVLTAGLALVTTALAPSAVAQETVYRETWPVHATDTFSSATSNGWSSADVGGEWTTVGTASVSGGVGILRADAGRTSHATLPSVATTDSDLTVTMTAVEAQTGGGSYVTAISRLVGSSSYGVTARLYTSGADLILRESGKDMTRMTLPWKPAAGEQIRVRTQAVGTNPTTVRAKAWRAGTSEPGSWMLEATSSTAALQRKGAVRLEAYLSGSATHGPATYRFDDLRVGTSAPVRVANALPTASFSAKVDDLKASVDAGASKDSDGTISSYRWDFGDGASATGRTASHSYGKSGTYAIRLTVTDNDGSTATTTRNVTATAPKPTTNPIGGRADASNTGVPEGTKITKVHHGNLVITEPGTVIDGWDIRGYVTVRAKDVVIRNSYIRGNPNPERNDLVRVQGNAYSATIEDSTLVATTASPNVDGVKGWNFTIRRTEIANVVDPVHIHGSNVLVEQSWLHSNSYFAKDPNWNGGPSHDDSIQIQKGDNITIRTSTITDSSSAAIMVTQGAGAVSNLTIDDNFIDNGACSINIPSDYRGAPKNVTITDNTFGRGQEYKNCGVRVAKSFPLSMSGNVWSDGVVLKRTDV